jgi:nucleoside 2-deoxyribosyltransferase
VNERPTLQSIDQAIRQGESEYLEFKRRFTTDADIARSLVAFANSDGGILLLGVDETPHGVEVAGLNVAEVAPTLDRLRHLVGSLLPTPIPVGVVDIEGRPVVYASVNPLPPHLKPATTATGEAYQRDVDRDVPLEWQPLPRPASPGTRPFRIFVAMSFREEEEPALVDYYRAMERAAQRVNAPSIELVRIDRVEGDYEISTQIMQEIDACDAVLGDFTLSPRNVYFEVGYARGRDKRIFQTARRDTVLEFDTRNWRTLFYRNATELEEHLYAEFAAIWNQSP